MFKKQLRFGKLGESKISSWVRSRGSYVLPAYEIEQQTGKGPRIFAPYGKEYISPDLLVFSHDGVSWIEAKHKTVFTWHRITQRWTTGIDRNHFHGYMQLADEWPWAIWLLFLHESATPDDRDINAGCPESCPVGLFGNELFYLSENINHEHDNWGKYGMVYWEHEKLKLIATLEEVNKAHKEIMIDA